MTCHMTGHGMSCDETWTLGLHKHFVHHFGHMSGLCHMSHVTLFSTVTFIIWLCIITISSFMMQKIAKFRHPNTKQDKTYCILFAIHCVYLSQFVPSQLIQNWAGCLLQGCKASQTTHNTLHVTAEASIYSDFNQVNWWRIEQVSFYRETNKAKQYTTYCTWLPKPVSIYSNLNHVNWLTFEQVAFHKDTNKAKQPATHCVCPSQSTYSNFNQVNWLGIDQVAI